MIQGCLAERQKAKGGRCVGKSAYRCRTGELDDKTLTLLLGWKPEEVYVLCADMRKELRNPKVHGIHRVNGVYARKPDEMVLHGVFEYRVLHLLFTS